MRLLTLLPLAAVGLQAPNQRAPIQRRQTARAAFSFSEAADSLKLDEASSKAADAAAKASQSFVGASSKLGAQTSDAVAASSKATFEAAQSALKVVDSDAVKNALKAGDGAADATAQAIKRSADALSSVKVDTSAFDKAAQRAAEAAERAAQAGAKSSATISKFEAPDLGKKLSSIDASGINKGFADAGKKISASVDAKTLTTNLDEGMKQLGKNLAVDVRAEIKISWRVLNHRVFLHAIDATPARWRGDAGSSPRSTWRARPRRRRAPDSLVDLCTGRRRQQGHSSELCQCRQEIVFRGYEWY